MEEMYWCEHLNYDWVVTLIRRAKNGRSRISGKNISNSNRSLIYIGYAQTELVKKRKFIRCLDYVHFEFSSDLEAAMGGLIEALMEYEEKGEVHGVPGSICL